MPFVPDTFFSAAVQKFLREHLEELALVSKT